MFNLASKARPYFGAVVLTAGLLTAGGIYSATRMPSGVYPEVMFPRIAVVAKKPGLDLINMELQVTQPLEQAVRGVIGVQRVRSKTIRGGCELSIDFDPGTDMRWAKTETWNRVGAARGQMPADLELTIEQMTPSVFPIMSVVLTGGDSPAQLRDYAYYQLAPRIKNLPDVTYAIVSGGDLREIEVVARPNDLLAMNLSAADLADQISKAHRLQGVGRIEQDPLAFQILVNTQETSARSIEELVIATKNNQPVRVRDVADVSVMHQDRTHSVGYQGKDAVVITIFRRLGGNTLTIAQNVRELLVKQPPPRNIQSTIGVDWSQFIATAVNNVRDAILVGSLFSVLILLAFLRSWRATLISALAIPTTLAITFLFLHWAGETLNLMTLGGLAVAIGLIIDDTVVVVENISRHLVSGGGANTSDSTHPSPDPVDAASSEITGAVVGSTLTTVLVFVPLAFMVGVYGQFFAALSWSLSIAVLVSMVISLTLVPVFAAKFLRRGGVRPPGRIYEFIAGIYERVLGLVLRLPWVLLLVLLPFQFVAALALGYVLVEGIPSQEPVAEGKAPEKLFKGVQTGLLPAMDEGAFIVDYYAPAGTPLQQTVEMARTIEHILEENPDVDSYVRRTGSEDGFFATKTSRGDIQVILRSAEDDPRSLLNKPVRPKFDDLEKELKKQGKTVEGEKANIRANYRRRALKEIMDEIEDEIKEHFGEHQMKFEVIPKLADELNDLSGANRPVEVKLFGPDHVKLRELGEELGEMLEKNGKGHGIKEVNSGIFAGNPDLMIKVEGHWAARGLRAQDVERQLQAIYLGQIATQVRESALRITDVRVRYPDNLRFGRGRFDPDLLMQQWVLLPEGLAPPVDPNLTTVRPLIGMTRAVPLSAIAELKRVRTPDEQIRENQQPAVIITAELNESEAGLDAVVSDIKHWMADFEKTKMPRGSGYRWEIGGHYLHQQQAFRSLTIVMVVAILLVFIMLAFQFRSLMLPLLIFLTQPLSLVSGLLALWVTGTPLNVSSYMGAILLIGLDMKNGILLVEYIQQLRSEGMELRPALLLAGRTRFRPILMTSLAAILGLFPLALGIGPGAQMQKPLAIMVIGGLTANMLFTRMVIPIGYLVLAGRKAAVKPA